MMNEALIRAWRFHRQGLDGSMAGASPAAVLERSGWARSVGGVGPYLTLFARAGTTRAAADAAVATLEIHELPAARGCTYVVPASDFALALTLSQEPTGAMAAARTLGVGDAEVDALCSAVVTALGAGALAPEELREAVGGKARSLGEAGKKKGLSTTLPLALGRLQSSGEIRRVPTNGRLDQQRYRYVRWDPSPLVSRVLSVEEAHVELARRYFSWIGPATLAEFQWFSGLGVGAAKAAVAPLGLVKLSGEDDRLMHAADFEALRSFRLPRTFQGALLGSLDAIAAMRRNISDLLEASDRDREVFAERGRATAGSITDLPHHAILDRGRLVGFWDYDHLARELVWATFEPAVAALEAQIERTEAFVRDELGDARAFSLDSPASREPRLAALRRRA